MPVSAVSYRISAVSYRELLQLENELLQLASCYSWQIKSQLPNIGIEPANLR